MRNINIKLRRGIIGIRRSVISSTCHFLVSAFMYSSQPFDRHHPRMADIALRFTTFVPIAEMHVNYIILIQSFYVEF